MDEMDFYNRHYITTDERGSIVDGFSDAFRAPSETDICINEQGSYHFRLFPGGEENPALIDSKNMIPLYKYDNGVISRRSAEEIAADIAEATATDTAPSEAEDTAAMLVDHEFRLTMLELGLTE